MELVDGLIRSRVNAAYLRESLRLPAPTGLHWYSVPEKALHADGLNVLKI